MISLFFCSTMTMSSAGSSSSSEESYNDDDFARLDMAHRPTLSKGTHTEPLPLPSTEPNTKLISPLLPINRTQTQPTQPFLPRAAEAELYQLATNFLLYVAMVLIITLVARIYFPEAVRNRTRSYSSPPPPMQNKVADSSQSYSDRRPMKQEEEEEESNTAGTANIHDSMENANTTNQHIFPDALDSEANIHVVIQSIQVAEPEEAPDALLPNKEEQELVQLLPAQKKKRKKKKRTGGFVDSTMSLHSSSPTSSTHPSRFSTTFLFDPETPNSRSSVLKRLAFCAISLNITFVVWGLVQERMLTRRYPRFTGEYFTYSYALVFTNRFWTLILSGLLLLYLKPQRSQTTVIYEYSFPSISNMLSSWCQYESLKYVSFPAATLFKSFKLAPVMAMGMILGNKKYPNYDYTVALLIGIGISMFMSSTDDLKVSFRYNTYEQEEDTSGVVVVGESTLLQHTDGAAWTGIMLLLLFLFFDSFTSQWQSRMFQRHVDLSMVELIFATSAYSTLLSFITLVHTNELFPAIQFMYRHSEIHLHFFIFSICSTIGQILIFYTIKNFGAVVFTIIMTIRILTSIGLSVILYDHQITALGFFGLVTVMGAIGYRIKRQAENSNLIKWKGMDDHKAFSLVKEWHEHVDM